MKQTPNTFLKLYILQALSKGFAVFYFILLPIFYAQNFITSSQIGTIGGSYIIALIFGAFMVARWLHTLETKSILLICSILTIISSTILFFANQSLNVSSLFLAYIIMGLAMGLGKSGVNAVAAELTTKGDRYKELAKLEMVMDLVRIIFPVVASVLVALGATFLATIFIVITAFIFLFFVLSSSYSTAAVKVPVLSIKGLKHNRLFHYVLTLEFLDSFSSSQLFVFLPLLFLAKGYSLENSLLLQACIFLGYLTGRWFISYLANKFSGLKAVAAAEVGMVICIILFLFINSLIALYALTFIFGVFARGTSPAIKSLVFDSLDEDQMKKGSAIYIIVGDSGSALSQLLFGFFVAWYGVNSPFIVSAVVGVLIAVMCSVKVKTN